MKKILLTAIIPVILFLGCSFYDKFPNISIETSEGIIKDKSEYFLLKYKIYFPAKGIAAFPDGGVPKTAFEKYYLIKKNGDKIANFADPDLSGYHKILIKNSKFRLKNNKLFLTLTYYDKKSVKMKKDTISIDLKSRKIISEKLPDNSENSEYLSISVTSKTGLDLLFSKEEILADPVKYIKLRKNDYLNTVKESLGNKYFRYALIGKLIRSNEKSILEEIMTFTDDQLIKKKISGFLKRTE